MKHALAIGAVIAAFAAAVLLRAPSDTGNPMNFALPEPSDVTPATPQPDLQKPDAQARDATVEPMAATPFEAQATNPTAKNEMHPAIPANEPRSDAIVPPVKRVKPKDPVLAGDVIEAPKRGAKRPATPDPAKEAAKP